MVSWYLGRSDILPGSLDNAWMTGVLDGVVESGAAEVVRIQTDVSAIG